MAKGKHPPVLTPELRTYVVQALACFDTPSEVAKALKAEFGVVIAPQSIEFYDPTKRAGRNAAKKWRALFDQTRKDFLENTAQIGIAHRAVRMRKLQKQVDLNEQRGNSAMGGPAPGAGGQGDGGSLHRSPPGRAHREGREGSAGT